MTRLSTAIGKHGLTRALKDGRVAVDRQVIPRKPGVEQLFAPGTLGDL